MISVSESTPSFASSRSRLKPDSFAVSFYGWNQADRFMIAWRRGIPDCGSPGVPQVLRVVRAVPAAPARADVPLAKGEPGGPPRPFPTLASGPHRQPAAPHPESPRGASAACSDVLSPGPAWSLTRSAAPDPAWKRRVAKAGTCSGSNSTTDITGRQPARGVPFPGGRHEPKPRMGLFLCRSVDQATLMAPRAALRWRTDAACRFKTPRL